MISPQTEKHCREFKEEKGLSMELLSDLGNRVAEQYGLVYTYPGDLKKAYLQMGIDLEKYNDDDSWRLPIPTRYIIDQNRVIRYAVANADHTIRTDPEHTIKALKEMVG